MLKGHQLYPVEALFDNVTSRPQGHVKALQVAMARLKLPALLRARTFPRRNLVCAMRAARILAAKPNLPPHAGGTDCSLAEDFGVADANENDLYAAVD